MLSSLKQFAEDFKKQQEQHTIDPRVFEHPKALQVDWFPARMGGSSYKTKKLKTVSSQEIRFVSTGKDRLFGVMMTATPFISFLVFSVVLPSTISGNKLLFSGMMGAMFLAGLSIMYYSNRPTVFDKKSGYFYKSYKPPYKTLQKNNGDRAKLDEIVAMQILEEEIKSTHSDYDTHSRRYKSYELNLVLNNTTRLCVVDTASLETLDKEAKTLAYFLSVPVWNAVQMTVFDPLKHTA